MLRFYSLRIMRDYLGHAILLGLPIFLVSIMTYINASSTDEWALAGRYIAIVFILMFQLFGSAFTFEGLRDDFLTARKDRLKASPVNPSKLVITQIFLATIVTVIQGMVLIGFTMLVFNSEYPNLAFVTLLITLSAFVAQMFGAMMIFIFKNASKAQVGAIIYAILGPILAGMNAELPKSTITPYLERYSTPLALANTGIQGAFEGHTSDMMIGLISLLVTIAILIALVSRLSKRVIV